jgi:hypothetical protein
MYLLQDDIVKFVSEPASPPRLVEVPEEGKGKAKERHEVGEGDDTVIVEDTSDEDDEETLQDQERFQLRSRFSRPGLSNVPLIQDPPTGLEASLPAPPRKPRNVARKHVAKKLKVTETTSQEVNSSSIVVEYLSSMLCMLDNKILLLTGDSAFRPRGPRGRQRLGYSGGASGKKPQSSPHRGRTRVATDTSVNSGSRAAGAGRRGQN